MITRPLADDEFALIVTAIISCASETERRAARFRARGQEGEALDDERMVERLRALGRALRPGSVLVDVARLSPRPSPCAHDDQPCGPDTAGCEVGR